MLPYWQRHVIARSGHPIPGDDVVHGRRLRFEFGALPASEAAALLEGLVEVNCVQLHKGVKPLSAALHTRRIVYDRTLPMGWWRNIREVWQLGRATCVDLATAVCAELRVFYGIHARPVIYLSRPGMWHAVVLLPDGRVVDPSRTAGMDDDPEHPLPASPALLRSFGFNVPDGPQRGGPPPGVPNMAELGGAGTVARRVLAALARRRRAA